MASPVTPAAAKALIVSPNASVCASFLRTLVQLPTQFWKLVAYMFTSAGAINEEFRRDLVPPGTLLMSFASSAPEGYLAANGSILQRDDYPELYTAIGTTYGAGNDDGLTFTLPDFRDKFPLAAGSSYPYATSGGEATVVLTEAQMPSHTHGADTDEVVGVFTQIAGAGSGSVDTGGHIDVRDADFLAEAGSDAAHNNMPPYIALKAYIKT